MRQNIGQPSRWEMAFSDKWLTDWLKPPFQFFFTGFKSGVMLRSALPALVGLSKTLLRHLRNGCNSRRLPK